MISTVVRGYANMAQNKLYGLYDWEQEKTSYFPTIIKAPLDLIVLPLTAFIDVAIEAITPLLQTIESVAFSVFSALATVYYLVHKPKRRGYFLGEVTITAGEAAKMTMINLSEAFRNLIRLIGKIVIAPLNFLGQTIMLIRGNELDDPDSPSCANFAKYDLDPPGTRIESLRVSGFSATAPFYNPSDMAISWVQVRSYEAVRDLAKNHRHLSRAIAIPVVCIDAALEILKPLIAAIETIAAAVLLVPLRIIKDIYKGDRYDTTKDIKMFFNSFNYAFDFLAQSVSMAVLSPLNLIVQLCKTLHTPIRTIPIMAQTSDVISDFFISAKAKKKGKESERRVDTGWTLLYWNKWAEVSHTLWHDKIRA